MNDDSEKRIIDGEATGDKGLDIRDILADIGMTEPEEEGDADIGLDIRDIMADIGMTELPGDTEAEPAAVFVPTPEQLAARKRKEKKLWVIAIAALCVCGASTFMFLNGLGPFTERIATPAPLPDETGTAENLDFIKPVEWATAGENYKDLYRLIDEQTADYRDSGAYNIGFGNEDLEPGDLNSPTMPGGLPAGVPGTNAPPGEMATAGSGYYDQMPQFPSDDSDSNGDTGVDPAPGPGGEPDKDGPDFSDANGQVAGVREADVLKTDGKYIYAINSRNLIIVRAENGKMDLISKIPQPSMDEGQVYFEMYVAGTRLIAIRHGYNEVALLNELGRAEEYDPDTMADCITYPIGGYITDTSVDIFDISKREAPVRLHTLTQSGDYNSSRMIDGYLYLITSYYGGDMAQLDAGDPRTFVPLYARDGEQYTLDESSIYLPPGTKWPCYTVISGIDAAGSGSFVSRKSVYGEAGTIYVSPGAIYLTRANWTETQQEIQLTETETDSGGAGLEYIAYTSQSETIFTKLTIGAGHVEPGAQVRVPGYILNQFSLDEYGGILRVVMSDDRSDWYWFKDTGRDYNDADIARLPSGKTKSVNALYTLNADLSPLGGITDLSPGERVYSCRFIGDVAYFVTFRQADPLFSVDIGNPAAPKVLGLLKIPGFSEYLYPYADGRLFGLGRDADPVTGVQQGLKLTMFNSGDPGDVKELHTLVIGDEYSAAEQNHKAILVSADKALIAFPTLDKYMIFGYDDAKGFSRLAEVAFDGGGNVWTEIRGLFIGGAFYVVGPNLISAFGIDEAFAAAGSLSIDEGASAVNRWTYWMPGRIVPLSGPGPFEGAGADPSADDPAIDSGEGDLGPPPDINN